MALTKVTRSGITNDAIDADKIEDGTIVAADIAPGTITNAKLAGSIANDKLANSSITVNGTSVSLGGSVSAGSISWQSVKTADFNAVAGEGYFVDTDSVGAVTATLPGSPSAGDTIAFKDYAGTFGTNNLTIGRNGNNIQGVANDSLISTNRASVVLVYIDATKGWLYTNESNVADLQKIAYVTATGGTIATSGDYKIHTFTGDGCFVVSCGGNPVGNDKVDYLVIAGGGGASSYFSGGGGAGGYRESHNTCVSGPYTASPLATPTSLTVTATTYPVTVGGGGASGAVPTRGSNGSDSIFSTITSAGGGGGSSPGPAGSGGSGGGAGRNGGPCQVGSGNTPPVSPSQGNPGGPKSPDDSTGSGGGGAGGAGQANSTYCKGGDGGPGVATSITGSPVTRAGGGGGGTRNDGTQGSSANTTPNNPGAGGPGGGGNGGFPGPNSPSPQSGTANTGGGGGGGYGAPNGDGPGGSGGKGIVIIRYKFQ